MTRFFQDMTRTLGLFDRVEEESLTHFTLQSSPTFLTDIKFQTAFNIAPLYSAY